MPLRHCSVIVKYLPEREEYLKMVRLAPKAGVQNSVCPLSLLVFFISLSAEIIRQMR